MRYNFKIFLGLILLFTIAIFAQEQPILLKTVNNAYETILHFSPEDYHLSARGPGDERPRYGAQGIYAGDRYLVVWDINNFYVFDIQSYQKLATVATEFSIKDIVESDGVIYCLTINDYIYEYPSFENAIKNRFISTYKNLSDFNLNKKLLQSRKHRKGESLDKLPTIEQINEMRKQIPKWKMEIPRSLHVYNHSIYLEIEGNYLDIKQDLNREEGDDFSYLFLREQIRGQRYWPLINNTFIRVKRDYEKNNVIHFSILKKDILTQQVDTTTVRIKHPEEMGDFSSGIPFAFINNWVYLHCYWNYIENHKYDGKSILGLDLVGRQAINFNLPGYIKKLGVLENTYKYFASKNISIFIISYNQDFSFDVLKVEVQ
ncbi:MAG: hypothetical protein GF353_13945 [Candidatus Lokiarchaeota archaeon]|nr:hypothetical protein [Candidatus Lokiarchaeota archaeon]